MDLIDEACGLVASSKIDGGSKEAMLNVDPEDELTEAEEDLLLKSLATIGQELKRRDVNMLK